MLCCRERCPPTSLTWRCSVALCTFIKLSLVVLKMEQVNTTWRQYTLINHVYSNVCVFSVVFPFTPMFVSHQQRRRLRIAQSPMACWARYRFLKSKKGSSAGSQRSFCSLVGLPLFQMDLVKSITIWFNACRSKDCERTLLYPVLRGVIDSDFWSKLYCSIAIIDLSSPAWERGFNLTLRVLFNSKRYLKILNINRAYHKIE